METASETEEKQRMGAEGPHKKSAKQYDCLARRVLIIPFSHVIAEAKASEERARLFGKQG